MYFDFVVVLFVLIVLPWLLLAYIAASKRFGIGWHWAGAAVASLLAVEGSRLSLAGVVDIRVITKMIDRSCSASSLVDIDQLQGFALTCAITTWLAISTAAFVRTLTAVLLLAAVAWISTKLVSRKSKQ